MHQEPKNRFYLEFAQKATALQVVTYLTYKTIGAHTFRRVSPCV